MTDNSKSHYFEPKKGVEITEFTSFVQLDNNVGESKLKLKLYFLKVGLCVTSYCCLVGVYSSIICYSLNY